MKSLYTTPRHLWTQEMVETAFEMALESGGGRLIQDVSATFATDLSDLTKVDQEFAAEIDGEEASQASIEIDKSRAVSGIASVEEISRTWWMIRVNGIDLTHFKNNPVALAQHRQVVPFTLEPAAIAMIERVWKSGTTLKFRNMVFDTDPLAEMWLGKIMRGFVRMVSIGFIPHEFEYAQTEPKNKNERPIGFIDVIKSELTEISPVVIGANRGAFITKAPVNKSTDQQDAQTTSRIAELEQTIQQITQFMDELRDGQKRQSAESVDDLHRALANFDTTKN